MRNDIFQQMDFNEMHKVSQLSLVCARSASYSVPRVETEPMLSIDHETETKIY